MLSFRITLTFLIYSFSVYPLSVFALSADLDTSFGTNGTAIGQDASWYEALAIQDDGKIVAVGSGSGAAAIVSRFTASGSLDTSFSSDGLETLPSPALWAQDIVVQPDGKLLVMATTSSENGNIYVARYNPDGTLDTNFNNTVSVGSEGSTGSYGSVNFNFWTDFIDTSSHQPSIDEAKAIALQADGKIIIGGQYSFNGTDRRTFLIRLNSDGSIDTTFGPFNKGYRIDYYCATWTYTADVAISVNGDIAVAGYCNDGNYHPYISIYNSAGDNQLGYFTDSYTDFGNEDRFQSVAFLPDGKVIVGGWASGDFLIARFNYLNLADTELDASFDTDGFKTVNTSSNDRGWEVAVQPDGRIILVGFGVSNSTVLRFNSDGSFDSTFGTNGIASFWDVARAVVIQPDGKIVYGSDAPVGASGFSSSISRLEGNTLDTVLDSFAFIDETGVATSSLITSNLISITGLSNGVTVPITIENGEYAVNASTSYQTGTSFVSNNDTINVRHTSASTDTTSVDTTLKVGGILPNNRPIAISSSSDTFTSTTGVITDTTPNAFSFTDQTDTALSAVVSSNTITVTGIDSPSDISIIGGTFSINGGAFSSTTTTVTQGDKIQVQHTSSSTESAAVDTVLTIGGVSDTFTSITGVASSSGSQASSSSGGGALNLYFFVMLCLFTMFRRNKSSQ